MPQVKQRTGMIIFDAATTPPPPPPLDKKERGRVLGAKAKVSERRRLYRGNLIFFTPGLLWYFNFCPSLEHV